MRYGQLRQFDIANGTGIRVSLFVTGCTFACPGCFNALYQDSNYGELYDVATHQKLLNYLADASVSGLTILGGEPLQNCVGLLPLLQDVRQNLRPDQTIWLYSGYTFEQIMVNPSQKVCLELCDVLVDGLFVLKERDLMLRFCGSRNQRLLDVQKSLACGSAVMWSA